MTASKWKYFSQEELSCNCGCGGGEDEMDDTFMRTLVLLRELCAFPLPVTSAYRCPAHNEAVSTTGANGPHTTGKAVDIQISGWHAYVLVKNALGVGMRGIGVSQKGDYSKRFIHVDTIMSDVRPRVWSY